MSVPLRLGRQTLVYGAGILAGKAVAFVMLPIYTRFLTPADYGVIELIQMTIEVVTIFAGATLVAGIFVFFHGLDTAKERDALVSTALLMLGSSYSAVAALILLFAPLISSLLFGSVQHVDLVRIAAGSLAGDGLLLVPLVYFRVRNRAGTFVAIELAKLCLQLALNIVFVVVLGLGAKGVLISGLVAKCALGVVVVALLRRQISFGFAPKLAQQLGRFGVPLIGAHVAAFLLTFGDRYFLQGATDTATVGLYALAYQFAFLHLTVAYAPFALVWEPTRFEVAGRDDRDRIYARVFVYFNIALVTTGLGVVLFARDVLRVMAAPAFHPAADLIPLLIVATVLQSWANFQNLGIMVVKRTGFWSIANWLAALVAVAGYFILIPRFHAVGAAFATVIGYGVRWIYVYVVSQRVWRVAYDWGPVLAIVVSACMASAVALLAPTSTIASSLVLRIALFSAYLVCLWILPVLEPEERDRIRERAHLQLRLLRVRAAH